MEKMKNTSGWLGFGTATELDWDGGCNDEVLTDHRGMVEVRMAGWRCCRSFLSRRRRILEHFAKRERVERLPPAEEESTFVIFGRGLR
ncbi:unnamed protein product [Linum trigynum]|uniref:Uncharacterized protein n=1 Tax=Linum trigynum TaxID=586398 RepID=A0AAV2FAB2_9ROSI